MNEVLLTQLKMMGDYYRDKDENTFTTTDYANIKQLIHTCEEFGDHTFDSMKAELHGYLQRHPDGSQDISPVVVDWSLNLQHEKLAPEE